MMNTIRGRVFAVLLALLALTGAAGLQVADAPEADAAWNHLVGYDLAIGNNQTIQWFWDYGSAGYYHLINNRYQNGVYVGNDVDTIVKSAVCDTWNVYQSGTGGWSYFEMRNGVIYQNTGNVWNDDQNFAGTTYGSFVGCGGWQSGSNQGQAQVKTNVTSPHSAFIGSVYSWPGTYVNTAALLWSTPCVPRGGYPDWNCDYGPAWVERFHYWT